MSETSYQPQWRIETAQEILQRDCRDLAGRYLVRINGEDVGPWPIEHAAQGSYLGDDVGPLDITVWIGGRMVGIQLPVEMFGQPSTIETRTYQ